MDAATSIQRGFRALPLKPRPTLGIILKRLGSGPWGPSNIMSLKKTITSAAVALSVAAGSMAPLALSANAGGYRDGGYGYSRGYEPYHRAAPRHFNHGPRYGYGYGHPYYYKRHKNRTGKYIALGIGAALLGAIIASEGSRGHRGYDYRD